MTHHAEVNRSRVIAGSVIAVAITSLALWLVYRQIPDKNRLQMLLASIDRFYLALAILVVMASWLADTARLVVLGRSLGYKLRFLRVLAGILAGNFLTLSTPFLAGGAPAVVYGLHLEGLSWVDATAVVVAGGLASQLALGAFAVASVKALLSLAVPPKWIWPFVLFVPAYIAFMLSLALLAYFYDRYEDKVKPVLNRFARGRSVMSSLREVNVSFKRIFGGSKSAFALALFFGLVYFLLFFLAAPICFMALGVERSWWKVMAVQILVQTIAGITPTPGGSGTSELGIFYLFGRFGGRSVIGAYVLLWRAITFFFNLAVGFVGLLLLVSWGAWRKNSQ